MLIIEHNFWYFRYLQSHSSLSKEIDICGLHWPSIAAHCLVHFDWSFTFTFSLYLWWKHLLRIVSWYLSVSCFSLKRSLVLLIIQIFLVLSFSIFPKHHLLIFWFSSVDFTTLWTLILFLLDFFPKKFDQSSSQNLFPSVSKKISFFMKSVFLWLLSKLECILYSPSWKEFKNLLPQYKWIDLSGSWILPWSRLVCGLLLSNPFTSNKTV